VHSINIFLEDSMKKILAVFVILAMTTALVFATGTQEAASGPVSITVEMFDRGTDGGRTNAINHAWTDWIKEKVRRDLNINVTFFAVGRWSEDTDIVNLMAAGTAPDLCYTYNSSMIASFRDQGGILDIQPFVERLLPDMKKLLGADPAFAGKDFIYRNLDPNTGKLFSIPSYRVALAQRNIFIRKDWLDKVGLALPTNITQFHDALVAFRDRDPGNVGRGNLVPLAQDSDVRWGLANFMNSFITANLSDRDRYVYAQDRNILFPGYKEGVRLMNTWYNENLIYRDFALMRTADDFFNLLKTGYVGAFSGDWDLPFRTDYAINRDLAQNVPGAAFVPVDPVATGKDMMDKTGLQIFVPQFSRNPEAALRYLNWLCIPENYQFLQRGNVGVNHDMVNGIPQPKAATGQWIMNSGNNIDITLPMNGIEMGSADMNSRVLALSYSGTSADNIVSAYSLSTRNARGPVVVNMPTSQDGLYGQTLRDKAGALLAQAITAPAANFDRIWDAGYQDWMQSGAQELIDERTTIANSWRW
jgi:putative aldouronate transport system substrate-binding protein